MTYDQNCRTYSFLSQAQLSAFTAEKKEAVEAPKAIVEGPAYIQWRGSTYTAYGDRLKGFITQAKDALPQLTRAEQAGNPEEQLAVLEKLVLAFNEAKSIVRHSIATNGGKFQEPSPFFTSPLTVKAAALGALQEVVR